MLGCAEAFAFGAEKYDDRNWERGMDWGRLYGALQRHLLAFWAGEPDDPESGLHHLDHAGASMLMLMASVKRGIGEDTRAVDSVSDYGNLPSDVEPE